MRRRRRGVFWPRVTARAGSPLSTASRSQTFSIGSTVRRTPGVDSGYAAPPLGKFTAAIVGQSNDLQELPPGPGLRGDQARQAPADVHLPETAGNLFEIGRGFNPRRVPLDRLGIRLNILQRLNSQPGCSAAVVSARGRGTTVTLEWNESRNEQ